MINFVAVVNAFQETNKQKKPKSAQKENGHCGRQLPTNKYSKDTACFLFFFLKVIVM